MLKSLITNKKIGALVLVTVLFVFFATNGGMAKSPFPIDYALYFDSEVRDAQECAMTAHRGTIVISDSVTNPAVSCPDMFSWKLFAEIIQEGFWSNWASDTQTWPKEPLPLCPAGSTGADCCTPESDRNPGYGDATTDDNYPNSLHCPYFPGDVANKMLQSVSPPRKLGKPIGAHAISLGTGGQVKLFGETFGPDPGRIIRQEVGEITVRNKEMFDYIFSNNLYNAEGLANVFTRNNTNLVTNAPYQATNPDGALTKIDLPVQAIMVKSNWLYHEFAKERGLKDDPENPYIKKYMVTEIEKDGKTVRYEGEHWLLSFHISSKDIPQWVWATFEHVHNPGRCDFTGCNDSFGHVSADAQPDNTATNFTAPKLVNDNLQHDSMIFLIGEKYSGGTITSALEKILDDLKIGIHESTDPSEPTAKDKGWRSYRLKGSQVNFTNLMGRETRLANSITEGGFAQTSSCITCHSRAAVAPAEDGNVTFPLGIFEYDLLNETGYRQSAKGIPDKDWYHQSGSVPHLKALQTDFLWGMPLFVNSLKKSDSN